MRSDEATLGAEVGSIFVEFRDKKGAEIGIKKVKGRIYDGNEIKAVYIDEPLYHEYLFPDKKPAEITN